MCLKKWQFKDPFTSFLFSRKISWNNDYSKCLNILCVLPTPFSINLGRLLYNQKLRIFNILYFSQLCRGYARWLNPYDIFLVVFLFHIIFVTTAYENFSLNLYVCYYLRKVSFQTFWNLINVKYVFREKRKDIKNF